MLWIVNNYLLERPGDEILTIFLSVEPLYLQSVMDITDCLSFLVWFNDIKYQEYLFPYSSYNMFLVLLFTLYLCSSGCGQDEI